MTPINPPLPTPECVCPRVTKSNQIVSGIREENLKRAIDVSEDHMDDIPFLLH